MLKISLSLDEPSDAENVVAWLAEAQRRGRELDQGAFEPVPAEEVRAKAQALLR